MINSSGLSFSQPAAYQSPEGHTKQGPTKDLVLIVYDMLLRDFISDAQPFMVLRIVRPHKGVVEVIGKTCNPNLLHKLLYNNYCLLVYRMIL